MKSVTDRTRWDAAVELGGELAVSVEVISNGVETAVDTTVDGSVTLDARSDIRGRLDLTIVDPTGEWAPTDANSLLTPFGNQIRVSRGFNYPDGTIETVPLGIFPIQEVTTEERDGDRQLRVFGLDRSQIVEDARFEEPYTIAAATNIITAIQDLILYAIPDATFDFPTSSLTAGAAIGEEGGSRWAMAQQLATSIGMELYFDGDGKAAMYPRAGESASVRTVSEGEGGVLLTLSKTLSRQGSFNKVIATGENTGLATPVRGSAADLNPLSPTYYDGPFGKKPRFFVSQFITTVAQATDAAEGLLASELGVSEELGFEAIVDPSLEPGDVVTVVREVLEVNENHVLDSVTIPLSHEDSMSAVTRVTQVTS